MAEGKGRRSGAKGLGEEGGKEDSPAPLKNTHSNIFGDLAPLVFPMLASLFQWACVCC